jgi:hypothetical protein
MAFLVAVAAGCAIGGLYLSRRLLQQGLAPDPPPKEQKFALFESDDGFRGTYGECLEHERMIERERKNGEGQQEIHTSSDGFQGTFDEVQRHEKQMLLREIPGEVYEAKDGFRGTFEEVKAHEQEIVSSGAV